MMHSQFGLKNTSNKKDYIAEIYKLDDKGRKSCIMILEGPDRKGWMEFHNMLTFRNYKEKQTTTAKDYTLSKREKQKKEQSIDINQSKDSYAKVSYPTLSQ